MVDSAMAGWAATLRASLAPAQAVTASQLPAGEAPLLREMLMAPPPPSAPPASTLASLAPPAAPEPPAPTGLLALLAPAPPPSDPIQIWASPLLAALGVAASPALPPVQQPGTAKPPLGKVAPAAPVSPPPPAPEPEPAETPAAPVESPMASTPAPPEQEEITAIAAAYQAVQDRPMPPEAAPAGLEWLALARSLDTAQDHWRALFLGIDAPDVPLAGALAARRKGLAPALHAVEAHPGRFGALLAALEAEGLADGDTRLLQAAVVADPAKLPPRGALAQDVIGREQVWDLLRLSDARMVSHILGRILALVTERVRWLVVCPLNRADESSLIKALAGTGWTLVADRPAVLNLARPTHAGQPGGQLWRGPLA
ncbi:hypothetical protein ACVFYP_12830 [Roseomonas sp. F4]